MCKKKEVVDTARAKGVSATGFFLSSNLNVFFSSCIRFPNAFISVFSSIEPVVHGLELLLVEDEPEPGPAETLRASSDIPKSIRISQEKNVVYNIVEFILPVSQHQLFDGRPLLLLLHDEQGLLEFSVQQ